MADTQYVVLRHVGGENPAWIEADPGVSVTASSATAAIRSCLESATGNTTGAYVAVPLRSFKPVSVIVETKPSVQIGELA